MVAPGVRRWLASAWARAERVARTTGRAARGNHGSKAMIGVWLIGAVFAGGILMYGLTLRSPSWFHREMPSTSEQRRVAQSLENRIITEAYRFRGGLIAGADGIRRTGEDWHLRVTQEEATAWLRVKLPEWLANLDPPARVPTGLGDLQSHFSSGRAWAAGRMDERVYTLSTSVRVDESGVWLVGLRAGIGSLSLPESWGGLGLAGAWAREEAAESSWRIASGHEPLIAGATVRLEDGRRVRVLGARIVPGAVEIECRTEAP